MFFKKIILSLKKLSGIKRVQNSEKRVPNHLIKKKFQYDKYNNFINFNGILVLSFTLFVGNSNVIQKSCFQKYFIPTFFLNPKSIHIKKSSFEKGFGGILNIRQSEVLSSNDNNHSKLISSSKSSNMLYGIPLVFMSLLSRDRIRCNESTSSFQIFFVISSSSIFSYISILSGK